jgi:hypothetical protein
VRLVEVATGQERYHYAGHRSVVTALAFAPGGQSLITTGYDTTALIWDLTGWLTGRAQSGVRLTEAELKRSWEELASLDATRAYAAQRRLYTDPPTADRYLAHELRPVGAADQAHVRRLIADLDDHQFAVRQKATRDLEKLGDQVLLELRRVYAGNPTLETRQRLEQLLTKLEPWTSEGLRVLRAIEVLEMLATPEAKGALEKLATGAPSARLTQEAKESLERLARRPGKR